jgi:hypothetical protein
MPDPYTRYEGGTPHPPRHPHPIHPEWTYLPCTPCTQGVHWECRPLTGTWACGCQHPQCAPARQALHA